MKAQLFGIMTTKSPNHSPFPEASYYANLAMLAQKEGMKLFVFFPESISFNNNRIDGYTLKDRTWIKSSFPFPDVVYDRVFYYSGDYYRKNKWIVHRFKQVPNILFLNRGLPGKWDLYLTLKQDNGIHPYLPPQDRYESRTQLLRWLENGSVVLKPFAGGFGKRIFHLKKGEPTVLEGRNAKNEYFYKSFNTCDAAINYLAPRISNRYLIQKYLSLSTKDGYPFDVRVFMQKDEKGRWIVLGKGVRIGQKNKLTSNIHGGGKAMTFHHFCEKYKISNTPHIEREIERISLRIANTLERNYPPLFELGIDIGIDQEGKPWVLEANAKPGRKIFRMMGDVQRSYLAYSGPIRFARYLLEARKEASNVIL